MEFTRTESGAIEWRDPLSPGYELFIRATSVRRERTGVHARIGIGINDAEIDYDTFNVGRRGDRGTLVNSVLKDPAADDFSATLKQLLPPAMRAFCEGVWAFVVQDDKPERRGGVVERTPPPWLMPPYVLKDAGTILFAPPGRGKSWTGLLWAVAMDAGLEFPYGVHGAHPTMYVNLERGAASMDRRLGDMNQMLNLPRERPLLRFDRRGRSLPDVWDAVDAAVKREGVECVFLDSLSRAGNGDMNQNDVANRTMDALNALNTAWVVLGHTPRSDETHVYGSQMFTAAADLEVQLLTERKQDGTLGVGTKGMKANDVAVPPLKLIAYEFDAYGLSNVRIPREGEFLTIENTAIEIDTVGQIREILRHGAAAVPEIVEATGLSRGTVSSTLSRNKTVFAIVGKEGRKVLYGNAAPDEVLQQHIAADHAAEGSAARHFPIGSTSLQHFEDDLEVDPRGDDDMEWGYGS